MWFLIVFALAVSVAPAAEIAPLISRSEPAIEEAGLRELLQVRRVYVDRLTGGETASQIRDILINSLESAKLFIITENEERADLILRGAAEDLVYTDVHSSSEGISLRANAGTTKSTSSSRGQYAGLSLGENESDRSTERRHEAMVAVRLVNKDGDVVWATTQESLGAKYRGASADVAYKIAARLKEDFERARSLR